MLIELLKGLARRRLILAGFGTVVLLTFMSIVAYAQSDEPTAQPSGPITHTVAEGENLTVIAAQYKVTVEALRVVNNLRNADVLRVGDQLVIPGGEGDLIPAIYQVELGDSLSQVAMQYDTTAEAVMGANLLVNRDYVPAVGQLLSVISRSGSADPSPIQGTPLVVQEGETLLQIAARHRMPVYELARANGLAYPGRLFAGQRLRIPGEDAYQDLNRNWMRISIKPDAIFQGDTVSVFVENALEGQPVGRFAGQELRFIPYGTGHAALVGIDAFLEPRAYTLELGGMGEQPWAEYSQRIPVSSSNYITQEVTIDAELNDLLDPEVRQTEDAFLHTIYANFSEDMRWDGPFQVPVTNTVVTAFYGGGRSYNQEPVTIYHTGTDFDGQIGTPIMAAASGTVVFSDELELRGQTVIVDHGLGVMTGYYHLSEILVELGEEVVAGQRIGLGGSTGLSTGPHLHWDLRVMDVPVDGLKWTEGTFP